MMVPAAAVSLLLGGLYAAPAYVPRPPKFSWDTLPVFIHGSNQTGPINEEAIALMAKFPLVTVEKFQGPCANSHDPLPTPAGLRPGGDAHHRRAQAGPYLKR